MAAYGLQSQWTHNYTRREGRGRSTQLVDLPRPAQPMLRHCDWPDENCPLTALNATWTYKLHCIGHVYIRLNYIIILPTFYNDYIYH